MRLRRPIQTRFRYGYPSRVNLATYRNSQAHSSKGTRSLHSGRSQIAPTACRHTISGTISRPLTGVLFTFPSRYWFGLFPFRSPLLRESRLLSLPAGTEMFHFPALPPPPLCVQAGVTGNYARSGFPIRKSPDQCLFADFPGLIAGYNVLLRLLVPRHPPCALINLATTDDARVHCAVLKIRAVPVRAPPHPRRGGPVLKGWLN